jgi:hypothetical protein
MGILHDEEAQTLASEASSARPRNGQDLSAQQAINASASRAKASKKKPTAQPEKHKGDIRPKKPKVSSLENRKNNPEIVVRESKPSASGGI